VISVLRRFSFYAPAFVTGIGFNLLNFLVAGLLVLRQHEHHKTVAV